MKKLINATDYKNISALYNSIIDISSFLLLVLIYSLSLLLSVVCKKTKLFCDFAIRFSLWVKSLDKKDQSGVSRLYLIEIAFKNMAVKKTRTIITIGGMAIGISFIVFLVSVGYGLQMLVVSRVAKLNELRQAEVVPGVTKETNLNEATLSRFKEIPNVVDALPLIAVVGRVSYLNSISDLAIYGTNTDYLKYSALQPVQGTLFDSNIINSEFNNHPDVIETTESTQSAKVLGATTDQTSGTLPVVVVEGESSKEKDIQIEKVNITGSDNKQIVVNRAVLQLLNIPEIGAIGKEITISMVAVGELLENNTKRIESVPTIYSIKGVIPGEQTPIIYVPLIDIRSMGINNFSQVKVIVNQNKNLANVRTAIESAGYGTASVADTVAQIDMLFSNFRFILSLLGMVALAVAALGMFNTLTVSLLERTREIGLMKAMGMKSDEVKSLFLTESMIMGLYGGVLGLLLGAIIGKLVSIALSALSVFKGIGFVDISYIPPVFVFAVIALSIMVGIATGYFPAKRATRISALNALRYE